MSILENPILWLCGLAAAAAAALYIYANKTQPDTSQDAPQDAHTSNGAPLVGAGTTVTVPSGAFAGQENTQPITGVPSLGTNPNGTYITYRNPVQTGINADIKKQLASDPANASISNAQTQQLIAANKKPNYTIKLAKDNNQVLDWGGFSNTGYGATVNGVYYDSFVDWTKAKYGTSSDPLGLNTWSAAVGTPFYITYQYVGSISLPTQDKSTTVINGPNVTKPGTQANADFWATHKIVQDANGNNITVPK